MKTAASGHGEGLCFSEQLEQVLSKKRKLGQCLLKSDLLGPSRDRMRVWGQSRVEVKGLNEELRNGKLKKLKIIFVFFCLFLFFP